MTIITFMRLIRNHIYFFVIYSWNQPCQVRDPGRCLATCLTHINCTGQCMPRTKPPANPLIPEFCKHVAPAGGVPRQLGL
jgi:hypothetical protein